MLNNNNVCLSFFKIDTNNFVFIDVLTNNVPIYVKFIHTEINNIYQFEYGPSNLSGEIDIYAIMNFKHTSSIIFTISKIMYLFLQNHKNAMVRFSGSTESRTRLFIRWIYANWGYMQCSFVMYGYSDAKAWRKLKKQQRVEAVLIKYNNKNI